MAHWMISNGALHSVIVLK